MFKHLIGSSTPNFSARINQSLSFLLSLLLSAQFAYSQKAQLLGRRPFPAQAARESMISVAQNAQEDTALEVGKPIGRELAGGQEHGYQLAMSKDKYASVIIEQRGIDVVANLLGTDGKSIAEFDFEITNQGEEKIEIVAETPGSYRLIVKSKYPKLPAGLYEIRWVEIRDATEKDLLQHSARKLQTESKLNSDRGKYAEALPLAEKALELRERALGPEHPDLYHPLINLFVINFLKGDYAKAEAVCARALKITENASGPDHPLVARLLYNLAVFYNTRGDDARSESLLQRALPVQEKALGPDHIHVAHTLNRLGVLARGKGDFGRAELLFQRALRISENALGPEHDDVAQALNSLGGLYREKGDYIQAAPLYQRALAIYESKRGVDHPYLAPPLHNLATLYRDMGEFDKAEALYKRAISIRERVVGSDHPHVAGSRASLALLYSVRGDYIQAKPLYLSAVATLEKVLGPNHPLVAWHLSNLAKLYLALNDNAKAQQVYQRALVIFETAYGSNSYYLADILGGLARISAAEGNHRQSVSFQTRANAIIEHHLNLNLAAGSERQKLAYLARLPEQLNQSISLHISSPAHDGAARELAATAVLQRKGRVQDALSQSLASLRARSGVEDQALLDQLNAVTSRLARLVLNEPTVASAAEHQKQISNLEERREKLESEISSRSAAFHETSRLVTLDAVRSAIPNDAALVEFAVYRPVATKATVDHRASGDPRYVAYIIRQQGEVRGVELGSENEIDSAVEALRQALRNQRRKDVRPLARALDEKVMQPIRLLAGDAKHFLISPDGHLNLIPFEAFVDEQGRYLVERYAFAYLTSGRDLFRLQTPRESKSSPMVFADPAFGDPALVASSQRSNVNAVNPARFSYSQVFFGPLPGVADEVRALRTLLPQATFLTGDQATEAALKRVSGPRILHIATHGFFLENDPSKENRISARASDYSRLGKWVARVDNPLLRSGLALAGANQGRSGDDDGVLTALEASALDLWGTKLVVLSACDTGVGEVKNGDGVYGLRRALFLAGTESQLMSLWPVSDRSTRELMAAYYQALVRNAGRGEALRQVQLQMLRNKTRNHPYYWASFILAGEWANLQGQR